ncbi:MAG: peptidase C11, partial [Firmicutes bacterium]|nr:peptidase C11 [Bacillota bacterium]
MQNRPRARRKFVSRPSSSSSGGGSYGGGGYSGGGYSGGGRSRGGGGTLIKIIIIAFLLLGGGGGALSGNLEGLLGLGNQDVSSLISSGSGTQSGWLTQSNSGTLNTRVSSDARDKFTTIKGLGKDKVTIMVYMCGTDLESRSGMATSDINEMLSANMSDNVNIIMYTGGCSAWKNSKISSRVNQIWQVADGKFKCLDKNAGTGAMTDPNTLAKFINWTKKNFPANRNELIFWDHGGGSISGFGYDEKNKRSGSMTLAGIDKALTHGGVKFDFVGFDACLMATTETALMLGDHADYMIGSEETEPGIGWYYTNGLTELSDDTSMETIRIGQRIADDFTEACARRCPGQQTTLSVVDLAELSKTVPGKLKKFSANASRMIEDGDYSTLATARSGSKEFARSSGIDQIDFVHFAKMMDTDAANDLADTLLEAVKYNRTSSNISNSYGLSIYFPYRKTNKVDTISKTYNEIGMDNEYTSCIKRFAQVQVSGQAVAGGSQSPIESLFGGGSSGSFGGSAAQDLISTLLMGGRSIDKAGIDDLNADNTEFMSEDLLDAEKIAENVTANRIEDGDLTWKSNSDGQKVIKLTED